MDQIESFGPRFELSGEVICNDIANSRAVHRFVQKRMGKWIAARRPDVPRASCYFHVTFLREGQGHTIGCQVRVRTGHELWTGAHYGQTLSEALDKCLEHLIPAHAVGGEPQTPARRQAPVVASRPRLKILPTTT